MRSNDEIINLLSDLKEKQHISLSELARRVGMAKSALSRYFNKTREFPLNNIDAFAKALNTTPEFILGFEVKKSQSSVDNENQIIDISNQLNLKRQRAVLKFAVKQLDEQRQENKNVIIFPNKHNTTTIEVDGVLSAGVGEYLDDNSEPFPVTVPAPVPDNYDYAFKINGSSMEPYYHDGQVVFIKKVGQYRDGQTVAAIYDGCAYLKRLAVDDDGYATLVSLNPDYPNVRIDDKEGMKLLGVAFS